MTRTPAQPAKSGSRRRKCAYCRGPHESSDHSPPKCLLIWPPNPGMNVLTVPSCLTCNQQSARSENLVWIVLALVGRHPILKEYCATGGKVDRALTRDPSLRKIIEGCKNSHGHYTFSGEVFAAFNRVLRKTAQGLYYGMYDRVPPLNKFELLSIEHSDYQTAQEVIRRLRRSPFVDLTDQPLPSLTSRGLPNVYVVESVITNAATGETHTVSQNVFHDTRQKDIEWIAYQQGTLHFAFFQDEAGDAICVMSLWGTLICAVRAPWPNQRGALRKGRKNPNARS